MVIRVILAQVQQGKRLDYIHLCENVTVQNMQTYREYLNYRICDPQEKTPDTVVFATLWESATATQAFTQAHVAKANWAAVAILPWETDVVVSAKVSYVQDTYGSLITMWQALSPFVQQRAVLAPATRLTDAQWEMIAPILSPIAAGRVGRGRPRKNNRPLFDAVLTVILTGSYWSKVTPGATVPTAWRRYREWDMTGAWEQAWQALLETLDTQTRQTWVLDFLDCSHPPSRRA